MVVVGALLAGASGSRVPSAEVAAGAATTARPPEATASPTATAWIPIPAPVGRVSSAGLSGPAAPESLTGYVWPLPNARFTQAFGPSELGTLLVDGQLFHDGIDLASWCGAPIRAAHSGTVLASGRLYSEWIGWRGDLTAYNDRITRRHLLHELPIVIVIDDGNGYRSVYVHLSRVRVFEGDTVEAGQIIGAEGATGGATGCHLHYTVFSPAERSSFFLDQATADRRLLPTSIVARVDPLRVLPSLDEGGIRVLPGDRPPVPLILRLAPAGTAGR
jgi:murein DD-endopeptidase MepM/ murein hydrolase activator NlpD